MASPFLDGFAQLFSNAGVPISGAKLNFYDTGTATPKNTFSDEALSSANANPVVTDTNGRPGPIYLETGAYKVVITDASDNTLETIDPVGQRVDHDDLTAAAGFYRGDVSETGKPFFHLGAIRLWFDDANSVFRFKSGADPSSETDGTALTTTYDDAFNESSLLDLGGFKVWRQADGQWRSKNGTPSSASDGVLLTTLFSGDHAEDDDLPKFDRTGTVYRLWVDTDGDLRIVSGAPASDTDGKKIGDHALIATGDLLDTSSGTSVNTSNLGVETPKRITLALDEVTMDGTDNLLIQIGDSGGIETSGYAAAGSSISSGGATVVSSTAGFIIGIGVAARAFTGNAALVNVTGNVWTLSYSGMTATTISACGGGKKTLTAAISQITVKPSGSDNFDGGQIRVQGES